MSSIYGPEVLPVVISIATSTVFSEGTNNGDVS
jgi:hypothetical protein